MEAPGRERPIARSDARTLLRMENDPGLSHIIDRDFDFSGDAGAVEPGSGLPLFFAYLNLYLRHLETRTDPRIGTVAEAGRSIVIKWMPAEEYERVRSLVFSRLSNLPEFDLAEVAGFRISKNGALSVRQTGKPETKTNLVELWNAMRLPKERLAAVERETQEREGRLRESLDTESYMGGALIVTYAPAAVTGAAGLSAAHSAASKLLSADSLKRISKAFVRFDDGTVREVEAPKNSGTKDVLKRNLVRSIERLNGIVFDPVKKMAADPYRLAFQGTRTSVAAMTFETWSKSHGGTREDFNRLVREIDARTAAVPNARTGHAKFESFRTEFASFSRHLQSVVGSAVHAGFMGIFFTSFAKYQSSTALVGAISEAAAFMAWAKVWSAVGRFGWKAWEFVGGLTGGIGAVILGHAAIEKMGLGREAWKYGHSKESGTYSDGKSAPLHFASQLGVPEALDAMNRAFGTSADIGIKRIENVPIGTLDYRIPEITWFEGRANFGTTPWDWCRAAKGRTIDDWNASVDHLETNVTKAVAKAAADYHADSGPFARKDLVQNRGGKDQTLAWHLYETLSWGGISTAFESHKMRILEYAVAEISNGFWKPEKRRPDDGILFLIRNECSFLRIDSDFLEERAFNSDVRRQALELEFERLGAYLPPDRAAFVRSIPKRMFENRDIVTKGEWKKTEVLWTSSKKWAASKENDWFLTLLDDARPIQVGGRSMKLCDYFALLLDRTVEWKRETEFLREVESGNRAGAKWNWNLAVGG